MFFYFLLKKPETEQQRIIRYADTLILNSDYTGQLDGTSLDIFREVIDFNAKKLSPSLLAIWNEVVRLQPKSFDGETLHLDITTKYIEKTFGDVYTHLMTYNYINKPDHTRTWILNDEGKLMKRWGGHKKYQLFKTNEIKALKSEQQDKIYWYIREAIKWAILFGLGYIAGHLL